MLGSFEGLNVAFLARHGRDHRTLPTGINYRANIHALKSLGVSRVFFCECGWEHEREHTTW